MRSYPADYKDFCVRMCISLEESLGVTLTMVIGAPHMRDGFTLMTFTLFKNDLPIALSILSVSTEFINKFYSLV